MGRADVVAVVVASISTPHLMGRGRGRAAKTRGPPLGQGGRRNSSRSSSPHIIGRGPGRPMKTRGPPHGLGGAAHVEPTSHGPRPGPAHQIFRAWVAARPGPPDFHLMGRGPARPIKFSEHGLRPGPAHQIFRAWAAARPGPLIFRNSRPGPARPITFSNISAQPGPARTNGPLQALVFTPLSCF